jgi:hypothetical protein
MALATNNTGTGTGGSSAAPQGIPGSSDTTGGDPTSAAPGTGTSTDSSGSGVSSLLGDVGSFLSTNGAGLAEAGVLGGLGISQADSQKKTNDALAASLGEVGAPYTAAGNAELTQLEGGAPVSGALGASITQQESAAANLGDIANEYSTGTVTPAQQQQLNDYAAQQKAMVDQQLAASGNLDSSARQAAYQQIDNNVATMQQNLIAGNTQMATAALTSVQSTYSTLLNQALSSSEFGFSTQEAAVQIQIQSDTQLSQSLNQLFAGIARGFGNQSKSGGSGSVASQVAGGVAKAAGGGSTGSGSVAGSAAGGDPDTTGLDAENADDPTASNAVNADLLGTDADPFSDNGQSDIDAYSDSGVSNYDQSVGDQTASLYGGDPFGGGDDDDDDSDWS